ncbi:MAG: ice-binding family protein [Cryobacterium sp.]
MSMKHTSTSRTGLLAVLLAVTVAGVGAVGLTGASADVLPQAPVDLGSAESFAILSQSGVTDVRLSAITGDVGTSPITGAAMHLGCDEVTGSIFTVDAAGPACSTIDATSLTAAVGDMGGAYRDAAGRSNPDAVNLGAGEIGGLTLTPGLYTWSTGLEISTDVTLTGGVDDVFIMQVAGDFTQAAAKSVILAGDVQASNVFWQVAGAVAIGTSAHVEGTILSDTNIAMKTGSSIDGRLLAGTAVTLQSTTVTLPAELSAE